MITSTQTTTKLLEELKDEANADAWNEFDTRYRPILIGFARRLGLGELAGLTGLFILPWLTLGLHVASSGAKQ